MEDSPPNEISIEINHDNFRFAYDLVELVLKIRGELNPDVLHNLPEPSNYLFTHEHARIVTSVLEKDRTNLIQNIEHLVNGVYDFDSYLKCRNFFVSEWQNRDYSENSFISACGSIAYVAAHFVQLNYYCGALDEVVEFIASWIEYVLENGTIENSRW